MNSTPELLLQVKLEDAVAAEAFSTTLMVKTAKRAQVHRDNALEVVKT